jgi:hypothetical protein
MKHHQTVLSFLFLIIPFMISFSNANTLVELSDFYPDEIKSAGFTLTSSQDVNIEALVLMPRRYERDVVFASVWILNAQNRSTVWTTREASIDDRDGIRVTLKEELALEPGTYEVYYSTYPQYYNSRGWWHDSDRGFFSYLFGDDRDYFYADEYEKMYVRVEGSGVALVTDELTDRQDKEREKAFISFTGLREDELYDQIIRVTKPVTVDIYAIGEARRDGEFDFGWIVNLETRERVWQLSYKMSEHAGGARKNRMSREKVTLEPGIYRIIYVTDDSHNYRRWNMAPPFDPEYWGVTVWLENPADQQYISMDDDDTQLSYTPVVEFNKVRDREYLTQGFTLKEPMPIQIYALGEGTDGDMYDYGWIVNQKTRETVWKMDYYDTESAGGAEKNRLFDGIIELDAGNYMVYYITDGSHAYHSWNASQPFDKKKWGITVSVAKAKLNQNLVVEYDEAHDESILVKMTRVGDTDRRRTKITIDKDQYVNIYALGEGDDGRMYDYAWIENANTGKVVWEMTYRKTSRAGGARKNRLFDDQIYLQSGEYYVIYETDDSHSFDDWNESPPDDAVNYGITITLANGD